SQILEKATSLTKEKEEIQLVRSELNGAVNPTRLETMKAAKRALQVMRGENHEARTELLAWISTAEKDNHERYSSHLYSESELSALKVQRIDAEFSDSSPIVDGREVLQACFSAALERDPLVIAFGEEI